MQDSTRLDFLTEVPKKQRAQPKSLPFASGVHTENGIQEKGPRGLRMDTNLQHRMDKKGVRRLCRAIKRYSGTMRWIGTKEICHEDIRPVLRVHDHFTTAMRNMI